MILSWAGGGQSSSPPVQLWQDEEEEEEEGILLFVAIKYKKKQNQSEEASDDDEEDVNNNSDRLTDSGIGEDREKSEDGDGAEERQDLARNNASDETGSSDHASGETGSSGAGQEEDPSDGKSFDRNAKEGTTDTLTNGSKDETDESKREESSNNDSDDSKTTNNGSKKTLNTTNLEKEEREDDDETDLLEDDSQERGKKESPQMKTLADVVKNVREGKNEGSAIKEGELIKDTNLKAELDLDKDQNDVREEERDTVKQTIGEDECDIKVVNLSKTEREESCCKRVTWKAEGLEEKMEAEQVPVGKAARGRRSKSVAARGRGGVREVGRGSESSPLSERPSGIEIGKAWERSLRLGGTSRVRQSPGRRQLKGDGGAVAGRGIKERSSSLEGKRVGREGGEDAEEKVEGSWEEDGGGPGWRSLRRLRSKPHRPSSGR